MSHERFVKLVRDDVAKFVGDSTVEYRPLPRSRRQRLLREKLVEEALEYLLDPCLDELADVYEVVRALSSVEGVDVAAVEAQANLKRAERGGFDHGVGMYVITTAGAAHER